MIMFRSWDFHVSDLWSGESGPEEASPYVPWTQVDLLSVLRSPLPLPLLTSVADPERFDADLDPTLHADADLDPNLFS